MPASMNKYEERVVNFVRIPAHLEKFLFMGSLICVDVFLSIFTVLPLHLAARKSLRNDLFKVCLIKITVIFLVFLDPSRLYHSIRGQSTVKLYVIFNVLDIADKLCSSFGLDVMSIIPFDFENKSLYFIVLHFVISVVYNCIHSAILLYQLITLNVAVNSYSNALLTLLVSNQFIEIKSAVFKKFDKDNLFQLSCGDVIERFQLSLYVFLIAAISIFGGDWERIGFAVFAVLCSELLVDWCKHAFIGKFNHIQPEIYGRFRQFLQDDLLTSNSSAESVSRRIGFSVLPFVCVTVRLFGYLNKFVLIGLLCLFVVLKIATGCLLSSVIVAANSNSDSCSKPDQ